MRARMGFKCLAFLALFMAFINTAGLLPKDTMTSCLDSIPTALELTVPSFVMHK